MIDMLLTAGACASSTDARGKVRIVLGCVPFTTRVVAPSLQAVPIRSAAAMKAVPLHEYAALCPKQGDSAGRPGVTRLGHEIVEVLRDVPRQWDTAYLEEDLKP